jgi:hypothetical protein
VLNGGVWLKSSIGREGKGEMNVRTRRIHWLLCVAMISVLALACAPSALVGKLAKPAPDPSGPVEWNGTPIPRPADIHYVDVPVGRSVVVDNALQVTVTRVRFSDRDVGAGRAVMVLEMELKNIGTEVYRSIYGGGFKVSDVDGTLHGQIQSEPVPEMGECALGCDGLLPQASAKMCLQFKVNTGGQVPPSGSPPWYLYVDSRRAGEHEVLTIIGDE